MDTLCFPQTSLSSYFRLCVSATGQRDVDRDCASRLRGSLAGVTAGVLKSLSASHEGRADDAHKHYIAALE